MNFTPKTDEELNAERGLLKPGPCDFEVIEAKDKISSAGNEMIELQLKVWDSDGKQGFIFDYLVNNAVWKIKHFFDSIGNPDSYIKGHMDSALLVGATGKAEITLQKTEKYGEKPKIKDYIKPGVVPISKKEAADVFTNDISY